MLELRVTHSFSRICHKIPSSPACQMNGVAERSGAEAIHPYRLKPQPFHFVYFRLEGNGSGNLIE